MRTIFTCLLIFGLAYLNAQTVTDFESFNLSENSYLNNAGEGGGFEVDNIFLPNDYNPDWDSWSGWAISSATDTQTPGFMNQYSSITGAGYDGSSTYAVTFIVGQSILNLNGAAGGGVVEGFYINNGTYPYLSMLEGDGFAKKFGGETGDDPDYLLLTIKKWYEGEKSEDSIDVYLADYRFEDNTQDYILNEWTWIDLSTLDNVDSLEFTLSSTDNGAFGMNTPAYFCMDNFTTRDMPTSTKEQLAELPFKVFPNPAEDFLYLNWESTDAAIYTVFNAKGQLVQQNKVQFGQNWIDIKDLSKGVYSLFVKSGNKVETKRFLKL